MQLGLRITAEIFIWKRKLRLRRKFNVPKAELTKKILIATNIGGNLNALAFDITLASALRDRGHDVSFSLCGGEFDACMFAELNKYESKAEFIENGPKKLCESCKTCASNLLDVSHFPIHNLHPDQPVKGIENEEIAASGAKRFLAIGRSEKDNDYQKILRRYLNSVRQFDGALSVLLEREKFDVVIAHHGIYVPQGNVQKLCERKGIPFVSWSQGYRRGTYILTWGDTYHRTLLQPIKNLPTLNASESQEIQEYLASRDTGENDWIKFGITDKSESMELDVDWEKPTVVLLTNVSWDAQIHYDSRVFSDMHEWILETIKWFIKNPGLNLVVRIHPAELSGRIKSRDPVLDIINENFYQLPKNVKIVRPDDRISTYSLIDKADLSVIFATKAGMEVAALGVPLIIAGEAWSRNKGIGLEPNNRYEYFKLLDDFKKSPEIFTQNSTRALEVAHYFFFKKLIKVDSISAIPYYPYARPNLSSNWFEVDSGLFSIVRSIETETDFLIRKD